MACLALELSHGSYVWNSSRPSAPHANAYVLIAVTSCIAHRQNWSAIAAWAHRVGVPKDNLVLVSGNGGGASGWLQQGEDGSPHVMWVDNDDAYIRLPGKIQHEIAAFSTWPELASFTHLLKLDDTDILAGNRESLNLQACLSTLATTEPTRHFLTLSGTEITGHVAYPSCQWMREKHGSLLKNTTWETNAALCGERLGLKADGGKGYLLTRYAAEMFLSARPVSESVESLELYEDAMVSRALAARCILPYHISIPGLSAKWLSPGSEDDSNSTPQLVESPLSSWAGHERCPACVTEPNWCCTREAAGVPLQTAPSTLASQ